VPHTPQAAACDLHLLLAGPPPASAPLVAAQVAEECTLRGHTGAVASVAFVESGAQDPEALDLLPLGQLLSGSWDHSLRLWDCAAQVCTHTMVSARGGAGLYNLTA